MDMTDCRDRLLAELHAAATLPPGWDRHGASVIHPLAIDAARRLITETSLPCLPGLHVIPLDFGGLRIDDADETLSIEFAADGSMEVWRSLTNCDVRVIAEFLGLTR